MGHRKTIPSQYTIDRGMVYYIALFLCIEKHNSRFNNHGLSFSLDRLEKHRRKITLPEAWEHNLKRSMLVLN
jgi:hypothetical protein